MRQHRHALAEHQGGQEVALLATPQLVDLLIVGGTLSATVPGLVVIRAVLVVFAVGLVVLLVVGDQVAQREAVVGDDEVDRRDRATTGVGVQIAGSRETRSEFAQRGRFTAPEVAHRVAVATVPFRPQRGEVADLVATVAKVPGLGNELDLGDHRVLLDDVEEGGQAVDLVELPGQRGRQVEAEPVDVHVSDPVPQRVHDQLQHVRMAHQQAVAGAGRVVVVALVAVDEAVVRLVVDAAERDRRTQLVALGGVVIDHVEDDLDVRLVQCLHHGLELGDLLAVLARGGVGVVRRQEADGVVAPVVGQTLVDQGGVLHELVHRQQFDCGDAE